MPMPTGVPFSVFDKRSRPQQFGKLSPDILDYALFLPGVWLVCTLGVLLRLIGSLFVVVPCLCFLYAMLRLTVPPRFLSAYVIFCLFIAVLSAYQVLPFSWQVHFMEEAIVRQLIPLAGYFSVVWASKAYFMRRLSDGTVFFGAPMFVVLGLVVAPAIMFLHGNQYQGEDTAYSVLTAYGAFINNTLIAMFFVVGGIFLTSDWRRYAGLAFVFTIAATTHFAQFKVVALATLATLLGVPGRVAAIVLVATLTVVYGMAIGHVPEAMLANPNSGIRLAFIADALSSAVDTHGIGIGYGKESVKWRYEFASMPVFTFLPDPRLMTPERMLEALSTGVENSFVEALLRTGVGGFVLFLAAFFVAFPSRNLPADVRNHASIIFGMTFTGCFVNSALESPISLVGHAFVLGYLLALNGSAHRSMEMLCQSDRLSRAPQLARTF